MRGRLAIAAKDHRATTFVISDEFFNFAGGSGALHLRVPFLRFYKASHVPKKAQSVINII